MKLYKNNKITFSFALVLLVSGLSVVQFLDKGEMLLWFNSHRVSYLNVFFLMVTQLAEPFVIIICCILVLISDWRKGVFLVFAILLNTGLVQFLKRVVFNDFKRPAYALGKKIDVIAGGDLEVIEGMRLSIDHSFPSGHTMAGATLFFVLSLYVENKWSKLLVFLCFPLVALSRVYLAQHYFMDVLAGGCIAIVMCSFYYVVFNNSKFKFV